RFSTSSTFDLSFDAGVVILLFPIRCPLRIRVKRSPSGSLSAICRLAPLPLPARLHHAGDLTLRGQVAERDAGKSELPVGAAGAAGYFAAVAHAHLGGVARQLRQLEIGLEAIFRRRVAVARDFLQRVALLLEALGHLGAPLVLLDRALLRHLSSPRSFPPTA